MPRSTAGVHTTLRIPPDLHAQLVELAGDRGLGEEIRERLRISVASEPRHADQKTTEAARAIAYVLSLSQFQGEETDNRLGWYTDPRAFANVRTAIVKVLDAFRPAGAADEPDDDTGATWIAHLALRHGRGKD